MRIERVAAGEPSERAPLGWRTLFSRLSGPDRQPSLWPWLAVFLAGGTTLGIWFLVGPLLGSGPYYRAVLNKTTYGFHRQILLLFVPYGVALWLWWRGSRVPLRVLLGGAVFLHLLVLFAPLPQSQDFYQYLFYGRMQAVYGANPYVVHPSVYWLDGWYGMIQWPNSTTVYGPVWTLLSFGVARMAGPNLPLAVVLMKLTVFALDLVVIGSILALSKEGRDPDRAAGWGLLVYAWNPLVIVTVPLGGLVDVAVAAGLLSAMLARRRGRTWLATVLLSAATLVKVYAGIALLLHFVLLFKERGRREARRHGLLAAGLAVLAFAPYWAGWQTFRGLLKVADMSNKSLTGTIQRVLVAVFRFVGASAARDDAAAVVRWVTFPLIVLVVLWAIRRVETEHDLWHGTFVVLAVYVLVTPWYLYWYMVAPLALVAVLPRNRLTLPVLTFSGTTFVTIRFAPWLAGMVVQTIVRYGPVLAVLRREIRRDQARRNRVSMRVRRTVPYRVTPAAELGRFLPLV